MQIARVSGMSDPETLKDILLLACQHRAHREVILQIELRKIGGTIYTYWTQNNFTETMRP